MYKKLDISFCEWKMLREDPIAALLLLLIVLKSDYKGDNIGVARLSIHDLAEMVGMSDKSISSKLQKLKAEGCITIEYNNGSKNSPIKPSIKVTNYCKYQSGSTPEKITEDSSKNYGSTPEKITEDSSKNYGSTIPNNNRIEVIEGENNTGAPTRPDDDIPRQPYSPTQGVIGVQPRVQFPSDFKEVQTRAAIAGIVMGDEEAMKFFDYYASHGWMDGRTVILDWTRKLRGWHETEKRIQADRAKSLEASEQGKGGYDPIKIREYRTKECTE